MDCREDRCSESNVAELSGELLSELCFSHKTFGEAFYETTLGIERKSGYRDEIRTIISERLLWEINLCRGDEIYLSGQIRTYNEICGGKSRLNVVVFAREIQLCCDLQVHKNDVFLDGFVCKPPIRRVSPLGREICDLMLAVNRMYNKSDYIPCIAWGRNAGYAGMLDVGTRVMVSGRIQSREYKKKDENGNAVNKTAYEVSILKIEE